MHRINGIGRTESDINKKFVSVGREEKGAFENITKAFQKNNYIYVWCIN